ncbi:hypothetical protein ACP3WI_25265, partial [Salmonella enterica]|uniref:hypothetical protein n=1 Tax=Salmonella enterica TaxID=28901 RepID=UPI003CF8078F
MFANFSIHVGDDVQVVAVPAAAIVREGDGTQTLWTTAEGKKFARRSVKIGREQNGLVEVSNG